LSPALRAQPPPPAYHRRLAQPGRLQGDADDQTAPARRGRPPDRNSCAPCPRDQWLRVHVLEAGFAPRGRPGILLLHILNAVRDALALVSALGHRSVAMVAGHDFGASVAAWCALVRPDVIRRLALMSAPFAGPPEWPLDSADRPPAPAATASDIHRDLAALA